MAGLESLVNMDILDLHGNQISVMTNLNRLASLRVLNLAANALKKVPSLEGLSSLQELNVKRNRISKIASQTGHARKLERLYLSNNELRGWVFVPRRSSTGHFHCLVFQQALDSFYLCSLLSIPLVTWFFFLFFFSFFFIFFLSIWSKGRILYIVLISYVKLFQYFLAIQYQYRIETRFSHPLHRIYNRQRYQDYFDNRKDEKNLVTAGANILKVFQLLPESAKVLGDP